MPVKTFVTYSGIQRSFSSEPMPNAYTFNPSGRFKFLKVFLWKFLMKHGQLKGAYQESELIKRIDIDSKSFAEKIFKQRSDLLKNFNEEGQILLVGSKDYAELMQSEEFFALIKFNAEFYHNDGVYIRPMNLRVVIVPWMTGIVLMPSLEKLKC